MTTTPDPSNVQPTAFAAPPTTPADASTGSQAGSTQPDPAAFAAPTSAGQEAGFTQPPAAATAARSYRKIRRSRDDRVIAGVAGGLGRYVNVDPVVFRILFVVLTLFGGSGIPLYLFAWIAVPEDGRDDAPVNRVIGRVQRRRRP